MQCVSLSFSSVTAVLILSQLAAQQHELTLTRHYEGLLLARESQSFTNDLTLTTNTSQSLHRLAKNLRALLRTMTGEDAESPDPMPNSSNQKVDGIAENSDIEPDFKALLEELDLESSNEQEDWTLERECEIARLEKENDELRRLLKIDAPSLEANGITVDEASVARYGSHVMLANRRRSGSGSGSGSGSRSGSIGVSDRGTGSGIGMGIGISIGMGGEGYPQRSAAPGFMMDGSGSGNSHQQQQHQQQQQLGGGAPLQRALELNPGMRMQGRRAQMFPRGGAGGRGANPGSHLWSQQQPPPPMPERPWQSSNLDLSR